ncbi:ABC transporter permease [Kaustia mangrovi]|uniref:ABC transporter permease n=1 Tax=Kaustia mangrovi TaxID=2593653 RepID=A0A7S8C718_9HYPH|nr:ABC transporter permease [Kaustia mangrovi]QPC44588.1 ABC transporter permease [Kaustia mangrovi]
MSAGVETVRPPRAGRRWRFNAQNVYWLLILPAVALLLVFYIFPLFQVLWLSVTEPEPGLGNYADLATSSTIHNILWTTFRVCVVTTAITVTLGYLVAYAMVHVGRRQLTWMMFGVLLTFWLSVLIRAFAWVMLLLPNGAINGTLQFLGLIDQPLSLSRNEVGVVIGMVHFMLPLAILPLYTNMIGINRAFVAAARGLGASAFEAFYMVFLPLSLPGIVGATVLVFIFSLGFYITPAILGGGKVVMVAEFIAVHFEETLQWGTATMMASTLLIAVFALLFGMSRFVDLKKLFAAR